MSTALIVDVFMIGIVGILPVVLIVRWNAVGGVLGVLVVWGGLYLDSIILNHLDPQRDNAMLDAIWMTLGWLGGLMYCVPIYALKKLYVFLRNRHGSMKELTGNTH